MKTELCAVLLIGWAGISSGGELQVTLGSAPESGTVVVHVYDSALDFSELRNPVQAKEFEAVGAGPYVVRNIPTGEVAVAVYLDVNGNDRLDRNVLGIPREPIGFSNNYAPKGPPVYARATIDVAADSLREMDVILQRPLGERGRIAAGVGVIGRSNPYRDGDGLVLQAIPAITYLGNRVQILGPALSVGLVTSEDLSLALTGRYAIGAYEEDDSPVLRGLGDRDDTFMAGVSLTRKLPGGFQVRAGYEHDVLDRIGGGKASAGLRKSIPLGILNLSPSVGANWTSKELANHDFGVPEGKATETRPAYRVGDTVQPKVGLGARVEVTSSWSLILTLSLELLDDEVQDSPIVDEETVVSGFGAFSYVF